MTIKERENINVLLDTSVCIFRAYINLQSLFVVERRRRRNMIKNRIVEILSFDQT